MGKYDLTNSDIEYGVNRILTEAYATATISDTPELIFISSGPGSGKTAIEIYLKKSYREKGLRAFDINSDKIATFHPQYEDALEELPEDCYKITRQFVRPATPMIFEDLRNKKITIINENTLDKGKSDIENAKKFKESGYKISVNIMATDIFESRLSCYEREAASLKMGLTPRGCSKETQTRMYNSFVDEVIQLDKMGLLDDINVFIRGENLNKPPVLKYKKGDITYRNFQEAINSERNKQRQALLSDPEAYLHRIKETKNIIEQYSTNNILKDNALNGLEELSDDYLKEIAKLKEKCL